MIFKKDECTGYMYAYSPRHDLANKSGKVYEHIFVMSKKLVANSKATSACTTRIEIDKTTRLTILCFLQGLST